MMSKSSISFLILLLATNVTSFVINKVSDQSSKPKTSLFLNERSANRRQFFEGISLIGAAITSGTILTPLIASAEEEFEMKLFVDPLGYFVISTPSNFFRLRRSAKGDLPDSSTGKGRRGSSIFTAGDMNKAEIVAVER
jgi:hypothetical protein